MWCYLACRWHAIIACWVASFYFEVFNQPQSRWVTKRVNNLPRTNSYLNLDLYQHIGSNFRRFCTFYGKIIVFFSCWPSFLFQPCYILFEIMLYLLTYDWFFFVGQHLWNAPCSTRMNPQVDRLHTRTCCTKLKQHNPEGEGSIIGIGKPV